MAGWSEELDEMERHLDAQRAVLEGTGPPPHPYEQAPGLGPLPEALRPRAERVLAATLALEAQVGDARHQLSTKSTGSRSPAGRSVYLDQRA